MQDYGFVAERVGEIRSRIEAAAGGVGRDAAAIELMAVTKFHPLEAVEAAYGAGIRHFGENRVQEAEGKYPVFLASHPDARLEMIGHLQSNKARKAVELFARIQSVDSRELLLELSKRASIRAEEGSGALEILFELHTGEESKTGFPDPDALFRACDTLAEAGPGSSLVPRGLMTMAPFTSDAAVIRASFRALKAALEAVRERFSFPAFDVLSMGMTNDFEIAVEEGSTLLRVGTALFGERPLR